MIEAIDLSKEFNGFTAVDRMNLTVAEGEIRAVIGPNGAGKTTLINLLSGKTHPTSGRVLLGGRDVTGWPAYRIARAGLARTFQICQLFPALTVFDHICASLQAYRLHWSPVPELHSSVQGILVRCELQDYATTPADELSHGHRRLLDIATALAQRPKLLLLDEPTAGLSPLETQRLIALLKRLSGVTIVIVEHDMTVVFDVAQRITVMHRGAVLAEGSPAEVRENTKVQEVYLGQEI